MKTSIRNLILAGVAGVALVSASLAIAGGPGCSGFGPGHAGYRPAAMGDGAWAGGHGPAGMAHDDIAGARLDARLYDVLTPAQRARLDRRGRWTH